MGVGVKIQQLINKLREQKFLPLRGSVIEIGAQQLANDLLLASNELETTRRLFEIGESCNLPQASSTHKAHGSLEHLADNAPAAQLLWEWMGYSYASIDIDGSPNSIPLDLNYHEVPQLYRKKYDLVTNLGTTEHVANQLNAFKIIHDLAKTGGIMLHDLPAQGFFNHGLVNYNPKFFWMLARSNGYKWHFLNLDADPLSYKMPSNIIDHISEFNDSVPENLLSYQVKDCGITIMLQKIYDIEFVAPLDVPTGAASANPELRRRYWTVFTPNAFA